MAEYVDVPLEYLPWSGSQPVFRIGREIFRPDEFRQTKEAKNSDRQDHFEEQIGRIASALSTSFVPFYVRWIDGKEMRLDRGCVGHSIKRGFLGLPIVSAEDYVNYVVVSETNS